MSLEPCLDVTTAITNVAANSARARADAAIVPCVNGPDRHNQVVSEGLRRQKGIDGLLNRFFWHYLHSNLGGGQGVMGQLLTITVAIFRGAVKR